MSGLVVSAPPGLIHEHAMYMNMYGGGAEAR